MKPTEKTPGSFDSAGFPINPRVLLRRIEDRCLQELMCAGGNGQRLDPAFIQKALAVFRPGDPKIDP